MTEATLTSGEIEELLDDLIAQEDAEAHIEDAYERLLPRIKAARASLKGSAAQVPPPASAEVVLRWIKQTPHDWVHRGANGNAPAGCCLLCDEGRDAAIHRRTPPSTAGWLPISTAPKDGHDVLGYGRRAVDGDDHHAIIRWSDLAQIWAVNCMPFYPTHWQPLIAPSQEGVYSWRDGFGGKE